MGFPSFVFHHIHPMFGCDFENCLPPIPPAPFIPHFSFTFLSGLALQSKYTDKTFALWEGVRIMHKGTDCGFGIAHFGPPNTLIPVIMGLSKSKSHFGCASVKAEKGGPIAIAVGPVGINLNCGTIGTPTGVICPLTTVFAGMTWGDLIFGIINIIVDMVWDQLIRRVFRYPRNSIDPINRFSRALDRLTARIIGRVWGSVVSRLLPDSLLAAHHVVRAIVQKVMKKGTEEWIKLGVGEGTGHPQSGTSAVEDFVRGRDSWQNSFLESPPSDTYSMI